MDRQTIAQWVTGMPGDVFALLAVFLVLVIVLAIVLLAQPASPDARPDDWMREGNIRQ